MKKTIIIALAMMVGMGVCQAQSNDSIERVRQQEQLLKQQQKEQEALLKQQQKEQEALEKQQQKEAEKELKEQQRAEEKAAKEQKEAEEKAIRDQQKAEEKAAKEEQRKAEKAQKKAERRAAIGRNSTFAIDPYVGGITPTRCLKESELYNAAGAGIGLEVLYRYPLRKHWDAGIGVGARWTTQQYTNSVWYDVTVNALVPLSNPNYLNHYSYANTSTVYIPLRMVHYNKDNEPNWYFGLNAGYNFKTTFGYFQLNEKDEYGDLNLGDGKNYSQLTNPEIFKRWKAEVVLGWVAGKGIIAPGVELYFNLLPTYIKGTNNGNAIHEFGLYIKL